MTVSAQILFDMPQQEIASRLNDYINRCHSVSLISGFVTVGGIEAIEGALRAVPGKLTNLVVGAATWGAFEAFDRLLTARVSPDALKVHLGHTLLNRPGFAGGD